MNIYQFLWCDGYYSCVLTHDEKFNEEELEEMYQCAVERGGLEFEEWLISVKGFKRIEYARLNFDCGSAELIGGDNNG